MKKQLLLLVMTLLPMVAMADESGQCGENLTWTYEEATHTLTISGTGDMYDYTLVQNDYYNNETGEYELITSSNYPWYEFITDIEEVQIGEGVTRIGNHSFYKLKSLQNIKISKSVTSLGYEIINGCIRLSNIVVESENPIYDSRDDCNAIIETETNTLLFGCKNTTIPNSVTSIGSSAFSGCTSLTSIIIPNSVTSIGECAFGGSGLTSITIPNSVTILEIQAFRNCTDLTSVKIGDNIKTIRLMTFFWCTNLANLTIGRNVTNIESWAFENCIGLKSIQCLNPTPPSCSNECFMNVDFTTPLYVPKGSVLKYKAANVWRNFVVIREIDDNNDIYLSINDGAHGNVNLKIDENNPYLTLKFEPDNGWHLYSVKLNDENVTAEVGQDGTYTTPSINTNSNLIVVYAQGASSAPSINANRIDLSSNDNELIVSGTTGGERIAVYTMNAVCVSNTVATGKQTTIPLATRQTYIVKVNDLVMKYCY